MLQQLEHLFKEISQTRDVLAEVREKLHQDTEVTPAMRNLLEFLAKNGSHRVPEIARKKDVSRQNIQILVNNLLRLELVELDYHGKYKKSPLVEITTRGHYTIKSMRQVETILLEQMPWSFSEKQTTTAARVIESLRETLQRDLL